MKNKLESIPEDKKYTFTLKNGAPVELTRQDVIDNNLYKLTVKIPDIHLSDKLPDSNPLKKLLHMFESGVQNKFLYYKILSAIFFCYLWAIQISAFIQHSPHQIPMLFITLWGIYAIIRLNINPRFEINKLKSLFIKSDSSIFVSSITYSLFVISFVYALLNKDSLCEKINWKNIGDAIILKHYSYITYLFVVSIIVSLLIGVYDAYGFYEQHIFALEMRKTTISRIVFNSLIYLILMYFFPSIVSDLSCGMNGAILLFIAI